MWFPPSNYFPLNSPLFVALKHFLIPLRVCFWLKRVWKWLSFSPQLSPCRAAYGAAEHHHAFSESAHFRLCTALGKHPQNLWSHSVHKTNWSSNQCGNRILRLLHQRSGDCSSWGGLTSPNEALKSSLLPLVVGSKREVTFLPRPPDAQLTRNF